MPTNEGPKPVEPVNPTPTQSCTCCGQPLPAPSPPTLPVIPPGE